MINLLIVLLILHGIYITVLMVTSMDITLNFYGYILIFAVAYSIYFSLKAFLNTRRKYKKYDKIQKS